MEACCKLKIVQKQEWHSLLRRNPRSRSCSVIMSLLKLLSRSLVSKADVSNLYTQRVLSNFNHFQQLYWPQPQPNLCFVGNNASNAWSMMDHLSTGTFCISGQKYMERWNRRLKQHGIRAKLSKRLKFAGNRVIMWCKVRRRTRHPRGIQIPKKRHKQ